MQCRVATSPHPPPPTLSHTQKMKPTHRAQQDGHLLAPPHQRHVRPRPHHRRLAQAHLHVPDGHLLHRRPVEQLGLEKNDGVRVAGGRQEQALGGGGPGRHHHLDARHVREVGFRRLGVVVPAVADAAARRPHCQPARAPGAAAAVPHLGRLVGDLVEGGQDVIRELDFGDGGGARAGGADAKADDALMTREREERERRERDGWGCRGVSSQDGVCVRAPPSLSPHLLRQGRVEDPVPAEPFLEADRAPEDAAKGDVLAKDERPEKRGAKEGGRG